MTLPYFPTFIDPIGNCAATDVVFSAIVTNDASVNRQTNFSCVKYLLPSSHSADDDSAQNPLTFIVPALSPKVCFPVSAFAANLNDLANEDKMPYKMQAGAPIKEPPSFDRGGKASLR
jgi:hypothetical protein